MQKTKEKIALVWFRNDLRIQDQSSLHMAIENGQKVIALYCLDPRHFKISPFGFLKTNVFRSKFLLETLANLKENLNKLNISLLVYQGKPEKIIPILQNKFDLTHIYFQKEWTTEEMRVEDGVRKSIEDKEVVLVPAFDQFLIHPDELIMGIEQIPDVFTDFRKNIEKYSKIRPALEIPKNLPKNNLIQIEYDIPRLEDLGFEPPLSSPKTAFPFSGGEKSGLNRINHYFFETGKLGKYKETRNNLIGVDHSSKLSAWLANGSISPRTIYWAVKAFEKRYILNQSTYWLIFELMWRDYFKYVSLKHGSAIFSVKGIRKKRRSWEKDSKLIQQWIDGETEEPFVNANMIELKRTGWMSNRGRQNVASYFAKTLGLDWRIGASYFESMLIDYDVHSNYGNWMYVSGVGNDPRNRTFDISLQAQRYDPKQKYQNTWLQKTLFE